MEKIEEDDLYIDLCHLLHRALEIIKAPGMCTYHRHSSERDYESALEKIIDAQQKVQQIIDLSMEGKDISHLCDCGLNPYEHIRILKQENLQLREILSIYSNLSYYFEIHYGLNKDGYPPTILYQVPEPIYRSICDTIILAKFDFYKSYKNGELVDEWIREKDE